MKIQRERLLLLDTILRNAENVFKAPISGKFYYVVTRNRKIAEEERKLCYDAYPVDPKYIEYDQKRVGIFKDAGIETDEQLREISVNNAEKFNAIQESQRQLAEEYKDVIDAENKMAASRDEFFKEDLEVDLRKISSAEMPEINTEAGVNAWQVYDRMSPIINFPSEVQSKKVTRESMMRIGRILRQANVVFSGKVSSKFYAAVVHNAELAEEERKLCYEAYPVDQKYIEYDTNRLSIFGEEGITDNVALRNLAANDPEKFNALQERQRKLAEEYKDAIEAEKQMAIERDKYAAEEITVDLQIVTMDDIPELLNAVNSWQVYDDLAPMIDFGEE